MLDQLSQPLKRHCAPCVFVPPIESDVPCNLPVTSLRQLCIDFIGRHIERVESLVDFPDLIGSELFKAVINSSKLETPNTEAEFIIRLFSEAYGAEVLSRLSIQGRHVGLEESLEVIMEFQFLVELDLSSCKLGDDHQLLSHLANLIQLEKLSLEDNALSDVGVQRMTTPIRVMGQGSQQIIYLNLSCNPSLTDASAKYLSCYKTVKTLNLSGTKFTSVGLSKLQHWLGLRLSKDKEEARSNSACKKTEGWAATVVEKWLDMAAQIRRVNANAGGGGFYGRKNKLLELAKTLPSKVKPPSSPHIVLIVDEKLMPKTNQPQTGNFSSNTTNSDAHPIKQKSQNRPSCKNTYTVQQVLKEVTDINQKSSHHPTQDKIQTQTERTDLSKEEQAFLTTYANCSSAKKTPGSSFNAMNSDLW